MGREGKVWKGFGGVVQEVRDGGDLRVYCNHQSWVETLAAGTGLISRLATTNVSIIPQSGCSAERCLEPLLLWQK